MKGMRPARKSDHRPADGATLRVVGRAVSGLWFLALCLGLASAQGAADAAPEAADTGVAVVYNVAVPDSVAVARHYAEVRGIPTHRLVGLSLPTAEAISRSDFESRLQRPLVDAMTGAGWLRLRDEIRPATEDRPGRVVQVVVGASVRTLVLCYGVPLRVMEDASRREPETASFPEGLRRNEAAVDAELTVLPLLLAGQPISGPLPNPGFGLTNAALLHPTNGYFVVGRLDGPTPAAASALVDRAVEAERNGLLGRAYFDLRAAVDPAFQPGDRSISNAWQFAQAYGFDAHLDRKAETLPSGFPLSHVAIYAGWYAAHVEGPFAQEKVEFMPGAIAYHLHSFSAVTLRSMTTGWVGPLVARGVTATMGTVAEPYLDGTPDMAVALSRLALGGFNWGEAAVASQRLHSWQLTVVGDPLYRPFLMAPLERAKDLAARRDGRVDWALVQLYNRKRAAPGGGLEAVVRELSAEPRVKFSPILQEKLADFLRESASPARAAELYRSASLLLSSPQQRNRLAWAAAESLEVAGREREAYEAYRLLATDTPGVADPVLLYERLRSLSAKAGYDAEEARWKTALEKLRTAAGGADR